MFSSRYDSIAKQTEISNRLMTIKMNDVKEEENDNYAASKKFTTRNEQLAPMNPFKNGDEEIKVRFLSSAVN